MLGAVGKVVRSGAWDDAGTLQVAEIAVEGDFAEGDDDADATEDRDLCGEVDGAVALLLRCGLVGGRGAAADGQDADVAELEAVLRGGGGGCVAKPVS